MNSEIREEKGVAVVTLRGDVDLESSPAVRKTLMECVNREGGLLVDLAEVSYIDSSGVASLVEAFQSARKNKRRFALAAVSPAAMRVLELARLDQVFTIHASVTEALRDAG